MSNEELTEEKAKELKLKELNKIINEFKTTEQSFHEAQQILAVEFIPLLKKHWSSFNEEDQKLITSIITVTEHLRDPKKHNEFMSTVASIKDSLLKNTSNATTNIADFVKQINERYPYLQNSAMLYSKINALLTHNIAVNRSLENDLNEKINELKKEKETWLANKRAEFNELFKDNIKNDIKFSEKSDKFFITSFPFPNAFKHAFDDFFADEMKQPEFQKKRNELFKKENKYQNTSEFTLKALLITRVQRGPRYQMLLEQVVKHITSKSIEEQVKSSIDIVKDQTMIANKMTTIENSNDALKQFMNRKLILEKKTKPHLIMEQMTRTNIDEIIKNSKEPSDEEIDDYLAKSVSYDNMKEKYKKIIDDINKEIIGAETLEDSLKKQLKELNQQKLGNIADPQKAIKARQALGESLKKLTLHFQELNIKLSNVSSERITTINNEKQSAAEALKLREHIIKFKGGKDLGYDHIKVNYLDRKQNALELKTLPGKIKNVENEIKSLSSKTQAELNNDLKKIVNLTDKIKEITLLTNATANKSQDHLEELIKLSNNLRKKDSPYKNIKQFSDVTMHVKTILDSVYEKVKCEQSITKTVANLQKQKKMENVLQHITYKSIDNKPTTDKKPIMKTTQFAIDTKKSTEKQHVDELKKKLEGLKMRSPSDKLDNTKKLHPKDPSKRNRD